MSKRRTHSPEFKARGAMEAISGRKTLQEIAAVYAVPPIQVSQWGNIIESDEEERRLEMMLDRSGDAVI
jgi:transposase-like protein